MHFYKYQGTGNDFVIIDDRKLQFNGNVAQICDRKFGIGADGLMLLRNHPNYDFEMVYYNSDGNLSSMCGNGGRCLVAFAKHLGIIENETNFIAVDGPHQASINNEGIVSLGMIAVTQIKQYQSDLVLNTGSPHYIKQIENLENLDLIAAAKAIRYNQDFAKEGINVNFTTRNNELIKIRTYERGVEDETLSCGTGVTAAAISDHYLHDKNEGYFHKKLKTAGGNLAVSFNYSEQNGYQQVALIGPAVLVFEGEIKI